MDEKVFRYYLMDLAPIIRDEIIPEKKVNCQFDEGMNFAFKRVLEIMESQAEAFEIDPKELKLGN